LFETDDLWTRYLNRCCPSFELVPFFEAINWADAQRREKLFFL
jgi:hypothetical protein